MGKFNLEEIMHPFIAAIMVVGAAVALHVAIQILTSPWFWLTAPLGLAGLLWFLFRR